MVGSGESARRMDVSLVSASFWPMFDISPALGRFFGEEEDRTPAGSPVVVLGYGFWQSEYAGDPGAQLRATSLPRPFGDPVRAPRRARP